MRAAISKFIGLMIFISAAYAFADTKLPKCVIFTFGNCQGSLKYPNGDIYRGEFNYGQPNGVGKVTYANGDLYAGSFFEGQKHGVGDYTWADGNRYIGQFIGGNLEGRGAYYFLSKNKSNPDKYVGDFKKNVFNGDGIYTYGNGAVVSGRFKDGRKVDDLPPVAVAEAQTKTAPNSGVNQTNKYEEKNAQDGTVTAIKSNISKGKELLALADVSRLTEEKSSLANQLDSQAELDRSLRLKLEIEVAAAVIAKEKVQSIADENARLKSQIETQTELDRSLRLKLEAASADAVIAKEKAQSIADENARLKSKIETQTELDRNLRLKLEAESAAALIARERAQYITDENASLKRQIDSQAELDRKLRFKLEVEVAAAVIAQEKAQSIADENARLKSQTEVELEMERSLRIKMEGVQASAKNNDSEEIIKNNLNSNNAPFGMTASQHGKYSISGITNSIRIRDINSPNGHGGFYGQIATGYENYSYGSINSTSAGNGLTFTGTSPNQSTSGMPLILGIGYNFRISNEYMIGIGYDYSFQTQSTSNFPGYVTRSSGGNFIVNNNSFNVSNRYNLFVTPGYVLSKEALVYLKAGYSSEKFQYDHIADPPSNTPEFTGNKNMDGYILGLGYKQRIFEDLYGFAETNYMAYKNTPIDVNFISGGNITGTFNSTLNAYNVLLGVGYKF